MGRTSSAPNSARRLKVDKVQGLQSRILTFTSLVLHPVNVETRVKAFYCCSEILEKLVTYIDGSWSVPALI